LVLIEIIWIYGRKFLCLFNNHWYKLIHIVICYKSYMAHY